MSDLCQAVRSVLLADGGVSALTTKVYSDHLPQSITPPAIVMWTISSAGIDHLGGFTGLEQSVLQVESYGATREASAALWLAVTQALSGYRGTSETVPIRAVAQASGHYDREDRPEGGSDQYRYVTVQDFEFSYHAYEAS